MGVLSPRLKMKGRGLSAKLTRLRDRLPLTNLGLAVGLGAAATYWGFARPRADHALGLAAELAMLLVGLALVSVLVGARLLRGRLNTLPEPGPALTFEARRGFAWGLELSSWRAIPMLELSWTWVQPEGFEVELTRTPGHIREQISSPGRARVDRVTRRFVLEDGFGLARWVITHTETRSIRVLPYVGRLAQAPLLQSLAHGDDLPHPRGRPEGDRVDMRRYVPGDPLRLALWKVFARTGQLMVRTPERALAPSVRVLAFLPAAPGDEPAAAAARWAIDRGLLGDQWWFSADGSPGLATNVAEALSQIIESKNARGTPKGDGAGLKGFFDRAQVFNEARVVLFVPGRMGPWLPRAAAQIRGRNVTCVVVIDGLADGPPDPALAQRLAESLRTPEDPDPDAEALVSPEDLRQVTQALSRAGAQVTVLDRRAGRSLSAHGAGLQQAYQDALMTGGQTV